jgi:hypothetical protein
MSYQEKYLKYKNKFINLRKQIDEFNFINENRKIEDFNDPINKNKYLNLISQVQKGTGRNNNGACGICYEEFAPPPKDSLNELNYMHLDNQAHRETRCCHNIFHRICIDQWIAEQTRQGRRSTCPICRAPLDLVDRHHVVTPLILTSEIRGELRERLGPDRLGELEEEEQARLLRENEELEAENDARDAERHEQRIAQRNALIERMQIAEERARERVRAQRERE